tara:strand:- start:445 stop:711 length:267 start_codon:yes stop_codon:yes gene_type:complete
MATNITSKFLAGTGVIVTTSNTTRVVALHAYSTIAGTFALSDSTGDKIKFQTPASGTSDIYIGELGIKFNGTVSASAPDGGSITLFIG